jgi:hypothetical protein
MKICDQCGFLIFEHNAPCPRCAEEERLAREALAPQPKPSRLWKVLKWLLIGLVVAALAATAAITWILNSFGESLRSLG